MQVPSSQSALPSTMLKALTGHTSTHAPQPMQVSLSILTAMIRLLHVFLPASEQMDISQAFLSKCFSAGRISRFLNG
jgi:hypothetical protein